MVPRLTLAVALQVLAGMALLNAPLAHGQVATIQLNPTTTYLKVCSDDEDSCGQSNEVGIPVRQSLSAIGLAPGDRLRLVQIGDIRIGCGGSDNVPRMAVGVFSSSNSVSADRTALNRVSGAIGCGLSYVTWLGCATNDISQDFPIAGPSSDSQPYGTPWTTVVVPTGATHLILAAWDSFYSDNADGDNDYKVQIFHWCPADIDNGSGLGVPDGGVDLNDLLLYMTWYEAGNPRADMDNGSGTGIVDGGVDINDLLYFLAHFEAGC